MTTTNDFTLSCPSCGGEQVGEKPDHTEECLALAVLWRYADTPKQKKLAEQIEAIDHAPVAMSNATSEQGATAALEAGPAKAWVLAAKWAIVLLADNGEPFMADDVWAVLGAVDVQGPKPEEGDGSGRVTAYSGLRLNGWAVRSSSGIGGIFNKAKGVEIIEPVGFERSKRRSSHAKVQRTWRRP